MTLTLLEYVQNILSSLDSDEVNSISDSTESLQVANILKTVYFNIISRAGLPEHTQLIQLESSTDITLPVLMYIPDGIGKINWLKYFNSNNLSNLPPSGFQHSLNIDVTPAGTSIGNAIPGYEYVSMIPNKQFIDMVNNFNPQNSNVLKYNFKDSSNNFPSTFDLYYKNNNQPRFCTFISDYYVLFDSYDSSVDSTLQSSKTMAEGTVIPAWKMEDNFIPNIDEQQVPLLLNEAKSLAFFELKQTIHTKAEQENKRQWSSIQKDKSKFNKPSYFDQLPDFGRAGRYIGSSYFKSRGWKN